MTSKSKLPLLFLNNLCLLCLAYLAICPVQAYKENAPTLRHLKTAKGYIEQNQYDKAKSELENGLKEDPKNPDILNNLGGVYLRLSQIQKGKNKGTDYLNKAKTLFTQALDINPNFTAAWNGLADTYYLDGQSQQAITYYKKALSLSPKHAYEAQTNLANAQRDLGLTDQAEENYQKAIELNPLYAPAHNGYAELLLNKQDFSKAHNEIAQAIRLKPNYATAYYYLGLIASAQGNKLQALTAYLTSLRYETNSNYAQETQTAINKLGLDSNSISFAELKEFEADFCKPSSLSKPAATLDKISNSLPCALVSVNQSGITAIESYINSKKWLSAQKEVYKLLKIHPDDPVLLNELGLIFLSEKKYSQAEQILQKAIEKSNKKLTAAYYNLGQVYLASHNQKNAQTALEQAKALTTKQNENSALIDNALGILFKQKGKFNSAQSAFQEALLSGGSSYPVIHYNFGLLLEQMNKSKEAAREYKTYLQLNPHGLNAKKAQQHLIKLL